MVRDWGVNTFSWNTTALAAGDYRIAVYVRAIGSTSEAEAYMSSAFTLTP